MEIEGLSLYGCFGDDALQVIGLILSLFLKILTCYDPMRKQHGHLTNGEIKC